MVIIMKANLKKVYNMELDSIKKMIKLIKVNIKMENFMV
jgi:hypothetical protein